MKFNSYSYLPWVQAGFSKISPLEPLHCFNLGTKYSGKDTNWKSSLVQCWKGSYEGILTTDTVIKLQRVYSGSMCLSPMQKKVIEIDLIVEDNWEYYLKLSLKFTSR